MLTVVFGFYTGPWAKATWQWICANTNYSMIETWMLQVRRIVLLKDKETRNHVKK